MKCLTCGKEFRNPAWCNYCPACRRQYNKSQRNQPTPQPPTGRTSALPQRQRAQRVQTVPNTVPRLQQAMKTVATLSSQQRQVAVTAPKASQRSTLVTLNPQDVTGTAPIKFTANESARIFKAMPAITNFTVSLPAGVGAANDTFPFKVQPLPGPVVIAKITPTIATSPVEAIDILGADHYVHDNVVYILGAQKNFFGHWDKTTNTFEHSKDFLRSFVTLCAMKGEWVGKELDLNGTLVAARTNDDDIKTFEPQSNADNVVCAMAREHTLIPQRVEPVYDVQDKQMTSHEDTEFKTFVPPADSLATEGAMGFFITSNGSDYSSSTFRSGFSTINTEGAYRHLSSQVETFLAANNAFNPDLDPDDSKAFTAKVDVNLKPRIGRNQPNAFIEPDNTILRSLNSAVFPASFTTIGSSIHFSLTLDSNQNRQNFQATIVALVNQAIDQVEFTTVTLNEPSPATGIATSYELVVTVTPVLYDSHPSALKFAKRQLLTGIKRNVVDHEDTNTSDFFYEDAGWRHVVAEYRCKEPLIQFTHYVSVELEVSDDSPFGTEVTASNNNVRPEVQLSKAEVVKHQKMVSMLPPMITMGEDGIDRRTTSQLAARGVLGDIATTLGPIATAVFPSAAPFIGLATTAANMLNI